MEECGAPVVAIAGGEPLIHKDIVEIANGYTERKKFVYLCTNAILLERKLQDFEPNPYLTFSVHVDGYEQEPRRSLSAVTASGMWPFAQ